MRQSNPFRHPRTLRHANALTAPALAAILVVCATFSRAAQAGAAQETKSIFQVAPSPDENFNNDLLAASASSPTDIWAVGQSTIHYNGTSWTAFPAPMIAGDNTSFLGGVADISPTLAWAVGTVNIGESNPGQVIEQWNGAQWSVFPGPVFQSGDQPSLTAMATISPDDIWAVGTLLFDEGNALDFLFEHWNGTSWTVDTLGSPSAFLNGASADATNDVWAVGYAEFEVDSTEIVHWNGTEWSTVSSPDVGQGSNGLNGVVALAPNDVWAVGYSTPVLHDATLTLIEHFDGTSWSVVPSPNVGPANSYQSNRLFGLVAVSSSDIWAFGSYFASDGSGHQMTLLLHWNGTRWSIQASPDPTKGGFLSDLLWAGVNPSPGNVWIGGTEDEAPHGGTLVIHSTIASDEQ